MFNQIIAFFSRKDVGLAIGLPFTALVVGLIVYGNFFASSTSPVVFAWEFQPALHVCDTAPSWARPGKPQFDKAIDFWADHGWKFETIEVGPCPETCKFTHEGKTGEKTCVKGKVALDLMDQWFEPSHAGQCAYSSRVALEGVARDNDWSTITVPEVVLEAMPEPGADLSTLPRLPADAEAVVLAHEVGHCLVGLDHNIGPTVIPYVAHLNPKTGAVMNGNVYKGGWVDEGLPPAPEGW